MPEVRVNLLNISHLTTSTKLVIDKEGNAEQVTKFSFECVAPPSEVARLLYFQKRRQDLDVVIKSPQGELDLRMMPVNIKTGEIIESASGCNLKKGGKKP